MIDFVKVGSRISEYRRAMGLTQEELAEKLYVTRQAVSKWENGSSIPSIDTVYELSRLFSVSFEELLGLFEAPPKVDAENIFEGHDRAYIISKIVSGEIRLNIPDVLYQMSPAERMYILKCIKSGKLRVVLVELLAKLTPSEIQFLKNDQ